ncbi:MAG: sulfurtransferase-like selenium metabolism protein YedF [Lachnospiraceae bacterium]|nr:sulfurtransferase-like selenium metabolism protein YedF [Lachnospiraceae bacterium]MDY5741381.1 sulfurtransferase-like selenium metabolism protein YedF [Lachnospiraceae bacterium]
MREEVNALGKVCPIPVIEAKKVIEHLAVGDEVLVLVDNEVAVQNIQKMATLLGHDSSLLSKEAGRYEVLISLREAAACRPMQEHEKTTVVVVSSDVMGVGDERLGKTLLKGFLYALTEQDSLPDCILFYNSGVKNVVQGSESIEDLKTMAAHGVTILACGTCLNFYGLTDQLAVGEVTNMYEIVRRQLSADTIVKL